MSPFSALHRARRYWKTYGTRQLIRESVARLVRRFLGPSYTVAAGLPVSDEYGWVHAGELARKQSQLSAPLRLFSIPQGDPARVSIVTDSINKGSLYGGVGTAIILAALVAQASGARLRIVTRTEQAQPAGLATVLDTYGITLTHDVEFAYAPFYDSNYEIDFFEEELFITTSWWTTKATMASVRSESIVYLLQEDERMFYPHGDEHLRCSRVLANADIRFVINTRLLYEHLVGSGLSNIAARGIWFEPVFPREVFHPRERPDGAKRTLMFYARPNNVRNLFFFGIEILETAIARGIIDLQHWDLVLVGKDIPKVRFDDGRYSPKVHENLSWTEYAALAGEADLALCLMYSPHPSYPPFDLAASGAVVVTNRFGNKQDLSGYSRNIICGDPDLESMLDAMAQAARLAAEPRQRGENYRANRLGSGWKESLAEVVRRIIGPL
jgi:beta-1,2-rhamnosyltransferase WsaF-like protein